MAGPRTGSVPGDSEITGKVILQSWNPIRTVKVFIIVNLHLIQHILIGVDGILKGTALCLQTADLQPVIGNLALQVTLVIDIRSGVCNGLQTADLNIIILDIIVVVINLLLKTVHLRCQMAGVFRLLLSHHAARIGILVHTAAVIALVDLEVKTALGKLQDIGTADSEGRRGCLAHGLGRGKLVVVLVTLADIILDGKLRKNYFLVL